MPGRPLRRSWNANAAAVLAAPIEILTWEPPMRAGTTGWRIGIALIATLACSPGAPPASSDTAPAPVSSPGSTGDPFAWVYQCTDTDRYVLRFSPDTARMEWDGQRAILPQAISASGARYTDGEITFWDKGGIARIETPTNTFIDCPSTPATNPVEVSRLLGYDFRAVGQEPGWLVEIAPEWRMHILADYGEIEFFTDAPEVEISNGITIYRGDHEGWTVTVTVRDERCQDVMSGEPFPNLVTLRLNDRELQGCGGSVH